MTLDYRYMLTNRRIRKTYQWETVMRHESRLCIAIAKRIGTQSKDGEQ